MELPGDVVAFIINKGEFSGAVNINISDILTTTFGEDICVTAEVVQLLDDGFRGMDIGSKIYLMEGGTQISVIEIVRT